MLKKIILSASLFITTISFSQDLVNSIPLLLKKDRDVFQIVDNSKKEVALFISDKEKVKAILLDQSMQIVDSITNERPNNDLYSNMIGYNGEANNPRIFWSSQNFKKILTQCFNFNSRKVTTQLFELEYKNEKILQQFSDKGNFYILTILKNSSVLKLYRFDAEGKFEEKTIDLTEGFHFFNSDYKKTDFYGVLGENLLPFETSFSLQKITKDSPTSLTESAKKRKCYFHKDEIIITIDSNRDYTQLIILNLLDFKASEKIIRKANIPYMEYRDELNSNSFLVENKLYQIKTSKNKFVLTLKDFNDTLLKEYTALGDFPIDFKNTSMVQEGGGFGGSRELDNTSKFLRKVNNSNVGLSCYLDGTNNLITIGSVSEQQQSGGAMMMGGMFGVAGVLIAAAIANPTTESFNSYANRKVVKIDCLFDNEMNHVKESVEPLAFDKIKKFSEEFAAITSKTIYKFINSYYFGFYHPSKKQFQLLKFED